MNRSLPGVLALALVLLAGGCSKSDDAASTASASPSDAAVASAAPSAAAPSAAAPSAAAAMGGADQLGALKKTAMPIYPNAAPAEMGVLESTQNGTHSVIAMLSTSDDFATVDAWYKGHVDSAYKATHVSMAGIDNASYKSGEENALPLRAIVITSHKDASGKMQTSIMTMFKEKSS